MGLNTDNAASIDVDAAHFLRNLPISEEDKEILSQIVAVIATNLTESVVRTILEVIYGDTENDEASKATINNIVSTYITDDATTGLSNTIYNIIKKEDNDNG